MLTEKDYCDYETCVALREVGCRIETEWYIHKPSYEKGNCYLCFGIPRETSVLDKCDYIPRLSLYEAQKWLREEKDFVVLVDHIMTEDGDWCYNITHLGRSAKVFKSYEEALSKGIEVAVKILKDGLDSKR